jgi:3-oxoacyl-[acyl-carrier protein] reductase
MARQRVGSIVNISSIVGLNGNPGQANYAASKAGIIGLTKSVAKEMGARNIRVNAIAPGFIATEMTDALPQEVKDDYAKRISRRRLGQGDDIANVVLFLASDMAGYVTGEVITVDGGMM